MHSPFRGCMHTLTDCSALGLRLSSSGAIFLNRYIYRLLATFSSCSTSGGSFSAMALPVSIGDAILCTQLLYTFYKDYREFPSSHNRLHTRLKTADIKLKDLTKFITEDSHAEPTLIFGPLTENQDSLLKCTALYDNIRAVLDKYDPSQETSSKSKPVITKAKWAVCKRRSIMALLEELEQNMGPLKEQMKVFDL